VAEKKRNFVVLGLGTFGRTIATDLASYGNHVLGIDRNENHVNAIVNDLAEAIIADSRDEDALREAGVDAYDVAVVTIGEDIEASVLTTMNVKLLGVDQVWAKADTRTHHRILSKLGVDRVVHPEQDVGKHIAQMLHNPLVRDYLSLGNGHHIVDLSVPEELHGETVDALKFENHENLRCLGLMRGSEYLEPVKGETVLEADDKVLILGRRDELMDFSESLI
jgi:trk system potassium uptake protein TrkA